MLDKNHKNRAETPLSRNAWRVADAKNRFSELLNRAEEAPQIVNRRDRGFVVLPQEQYRELTGEDRRPNFIEFLRSAPRLDDLDLARDPSPMREVDLGDAD